MMDAPDMFDSNLYNTAWLNSCHVLTAVTLGLNNESLTEICFPSVSYPKRQMENLVHRSYEDEVHIVPTALFIFFPSVPLPRTLLLFFSLAHYLTPPALIACVNYTNYIYNTESCLPYGYCCVCRGLNLCEYVSLYVHTCVSLGENITLKLQQE